MDIRVKALRNFPYEHRPIEKDDVFEIEDYVARSLLSGQLVKRTKEAVNSTGFYNRRDMRATPHAALPQATRVMEAGHDGGSGKDQSTSGSGRIKRQ